MGLRGFEFVSDFIDSAILPQRADRGSAGYDIRVLYGDEIPAGETRKFDTGIKAYMQKDEVLQLYVRSSIGVKKGLTLANSTGIIDSSYYNNPDNEGHIILYLRNDSDKDAVITNGERVVQGIFQKYLIADNDNPVNGERDGGIGSTNK